VSSVTVVCSRSVGKPVSGGVVWRRAAELGIDALFSSSSAPAADSQKTTLVHHHHNHHNHHHYHHHNHHHHHHYHHHHLSNYNYLYQEGDLNAIRPNDIIQVLYWNSVLSIVIWLGRTWGLLLPLISQLHCGVPSTDCHYVQKEQGKQMGSVLCDHSHRRRRNWCSTLFDVSSL